MPQVPTEEHFDVFLSHSHEDAAWVENLAERLADEHRLRVWLDRWMLVPGQPWQPKIEFGLEHAESCAVCIGGKTPSGWFNKEIERALDRQSRFSDFRVIPVLLPDSGDTIEVELQGSFVTLNTWVDYRTGKDPDYAFHLLVSGVRAVPPGTRETESGNRGAAAEGAREAQVPET